MLGNIRVNLHLTRCTPFQKFRIQRSKHMLVYGIISFLVVIVAALGFQFSSYKGTLHGK
jgi:hypothetical protein